MNLGVVVYFQDGEHFIAAMGENLAFIHEINSMLNDFDFKIIKAFPCQRGGEQEAQGKNKRDEAQAFFLHVWMFLSFHK